MRKTSSDRVRHALSGPTMGSRWTALFYSGPGVDPRPIEDALQAAVDEVDAQMSTWRPDSDLMRLNAAAVGAWTPLPRRLMEVMGLGLAIGQASDGAFDIGMGDAVSASGFGPAPAEDARIRAAMAASRRPASEALDLDTAGRRVRKRLPIVVDLNGIAKGYGVDRLAEALGRAGVGAGLVGIDGEMRATGLRPDGTAWTIAVEMPDPLRRAAHSILALEDAAVATSGDYRHWIDLAGRRFSHTMDPRRGAPLPAPPASVTVVARTCAEADAWATALTVLGVEAGLSLARRRGLDALFLLREGPSAIRAIGTGAIFERELPAATAALP